MKNVVFAVLQFALFFALFASGNVLPLFHISWITTFADGSRGFQWVGLLLSLGVAILILAIETVRGRIQKAGPWTSAAFVLSTLLGLGLHLGLLAR